MRQDGKQRGDYRSDVIRNAGPAERGRSGDGLVHFRIVTNDGTAEAGPDGAGRNAIPRGPSSFAIYLVSTSTAPFDRTVTGAIRDKDASQGRSTK